MPGFAQNTVHGRATLVRDSDMFAGILEIGQSSFVSTHNMIVRRSQLLRTLQKQEFPEVVRNCRVIIMVGRQIRNVFRLSLFAHALVHSPGFRPCLAPVIPTLDTIGDTLKIVGVNTICENLGAQLSIALCTRSSLAIEVSFHL